MKTYWLEQVAINAVTAINKKWPEDMLFQIDVFQLQINQIFRLFSEPIVLY